MSNNFPFNSLLILIDIKNLIILSSSVFLPQESEQHLNSLNVFSFLPFLYSHPPTVDFSTADSNRDFEDLFFHFMYRSFFSSFLSNDPIETTTSQEEFKVFTKLPLHVFSFFSFFYYSLC
jgi:hypothetical protein